MIMKKILSVSLSLLVCVCVLVGCGGGTKQPSASESKSTIESSSVIDEPSASKDNSVSESAVISDEGPSSDEGQTSDGEQSASGEESASQEESQSGDESSSEEGGSSVKESSSEEEVSSDEENSSDEEQTSSGEDGPAEHVHEFGEYGITVEATLEKAGEKTRVCTGCDETETIAYTIENSSTGGAARVSLGNGAFVSAKYTGDFVEITFERKDVIADGFGLYYTECADEGLADGNARYAYISETGGVTLREYYDRAFSLNVENDVTAEKKEENGLTCYVVTIPRALGGEFSFYPAVYAGANTYDYGENNPFVLLKYSETWLKLSDSNTIYYVDYSDKDAVGGKTLSFARNDYMFVGVIKEDTVEGAIVAAKIAQAKGATGLDLHLNYLYNNGLLTESAIRRIVKATYVPILALNYNSALTQAQRREGLMTAVFGGCAAVDLQGFMFWNGSTLNTQTAENVAYWEERGYDMCFVDAKPSETVIDPETVALQQNFIDTVHALGAEVLMSFHVGVSFTAKQAVAFAKFQNMKGPDVIKVVGIGSGVEDVQACVDAIKTVNEGSLIGDTKFSFHLSGDASVYITRVICPVFYGSYIAFCYPELTVWQDAGQIDLSMAVSALAARKEGGAELTVKEAAAAVNKYVDHPQWKKLYKAFTEAPSTVGKAYGLSSNMSDRWSFSGNDYHLQLRDANGTNTFNMRAYAYDAAEKRADNVYVSAKLSGSFSPYTSSARKPKLGVYIGNEDNMLAFVYNTSEKTIDLVATTVNKFGYDSGIKSDVLFSVSAMTKIDKDVDLSSKSLTLAMWLKGDKLTLFVDGVSVKEITITEELEGYIGKESDGGIRSGVVVEMYLGSASVGKVNYVDFKNVSYKAPEE